MITDPDELEALVGPVYRERSHLLALLAKSVEPGAAIAPAEDFEGWWLLGLPFGGRVWTWHISPRDLELFRSVPHVELTDPRVKWDGHTTEDKYRFLQATPNWSRLTEYRILVTGSRKWNDIERLYNALDLAASRAEASGRRIVLVHGACPTGADDLTFGWVRSIARRGVAVSVDPYPADWEHRGNRAGTERNALMISRGADECLAFIRNESPGATHCAGLAETAGIPVRRYAA